MDQILGNIGLLFEFPVVNLKIVLDGIMVGALFALAAYGLALVWGVMNVKNLAQGDFVISGGYVSWYLVQNGFPALLGVPVAFVVMWGIGWVVYKLVISRVIERDLFTSLLATFGLASPSSSGDSSPDSAGDSPSSEASGEGDAGEPRDRTRSQVQE